MLQMVDAAEPGHLAWWVCDEALQREVLAGVTAAVCADGEEHCPGWAAAGECSTNRALMLDKCGLCTRPLSRRVFIAIKNLGQAC